MKAKRRRHDPEFKARVALEALKGIKPIQQIAKDFDVHPVRARPRRRISSGNDPNSTRRSASRPWNWTG
jgi:transposase-like protein